jgi:hypothetical protein
MLPAAPRAIYSGVRGFAVPNIECAVGLPPTPQSVTMSVVFTGPMNSPGVPQPLVLRMPLDAVDDEDVDGSVGGLELKAELTFESFAEGRGDVADI